MADFEKSQPETFEDPENASCGELAPLEPHLFVVLECDNPRSGGARYSLSTVDEVIVGRGTERHARYLENGGVRRLELRIPGRSMSATQARLLRTSRAWALEDARSTNGSFVNGVRVERAWIGEHDIIELGHAVLSLRPSLPTPAGTAAFLDMNDLATGHRGLRTLIPELSAELASLAAVASSNLPVLILGESGVGKELAARATHDLSGRSGPFVAVNSGALVPTLLAAQLFGHVKGAFSGALRDELGFIRQADGGTLLLDELGDLPLDAQTMLLRVLQEHEVTPIGSTRPVPVNVRIVAATNRPLDDQVRAGTFRGDLLARIDAYRLRLPALRNRREDLGLMLGEILERAAAPADIRVAADAGVALVAHDWPFNARELVQHVTRGLVLAERGSITRKGLALPLQPPNPDPTSRAPAMSPEEAVVLAELVRALEEHGGNVTSVARAMGKARMQVHRWLRRFDIDPARYRVRQR